jgi:hypothetical protein
MVREMKVSLSWSAFVFLTFLFAMQIGSLGCATKPAGAPVTMTSDGEIVARPPPPPGNEAAGTAPATDAVWVEGYWAFVNQSWVWIPGHWDTPPHPSARWVPGYWEQTPSGSIWKSGRWE